MAIILPHTAADIQYFRSNGVCYRRTNWGISGTPDHTWDEMVSPSDFGTYASCSDCQNASFVPSVCPCSSWPPPESGCGDPEDPMYSTNYIHISDIAFSSGTPEYIALDAPIFDGYVIADPITPCEVQGVHFDKRRVSGTNIAVSDPVDNYVRIVLIPSLYWLTLIKSGGCVGYWIKKTGNSFTGTYTLAASGFDPGVYYGPNVAISPTTITVDQTP